MNYLAHHFVISALNECLDMCNDAPEAPFMSLGDAVVRLYIGYQEIEHGSNDEYLEDEAHFRVDEAARALLYYAANSQSAELITEVYKVLDNFDGLAKHYAEKVARQRRRTFVTDNRSTTTNGEAS